MISANQQVYAALVTIQGKLKAPKTQFNKFGGYNYRKAEDILEAVKPLLAEVGCVLTCSDELVMVGDRYYIKATAALIHPESGGTIQTVAFAREEAEKKGMDGSQVTGASSSYARKYALNGLLCIDDTADSDTTNTAVKEDKKKTPEAKKNPIPQRGSEEWNKWAEAIATKWTSKQGKTARQAFADHFSAPENVMLDTLTLLEEDAKNFKRS